MEEAGVERALRLVMGDRMREGWGKWESLRGGGAETEAAGPAGYDGDFAFEGEEGWEVVELCFGHGDVGGGCTVYSGMRYVI